MKAKTIIGHGTARCNVRFTWESSDYGNFHGNYKNALRERRRDGFKTGGPMLVGLLHNYYYNCIERIDEKVFDKAPIVSEVKAFITGCYKCIES